MKMDKFTIEIDNELADKIVVQELAWSRDTLKRDLGAGTWVFAWNDQEQDDAEIQKHIDAIELLLKWYATPDQLKDMGLEP